MSRAQFTVAFSTDEEAAASKRMVIYAFSAQINLFTSFFLKQPLRNTVFILFPLSVVQDTSLKSKKNRDARTRIFPFVMQYHPALPNLKTLIRKWHLIQNQPQLREIFRGPWLISYCKGKSLKDILVRSKP